MARRRRRRLPVGRLAAAIRQTSAQSPAGTSQRPGGGFLTGLASVLDIPQDLVFDLPRITILGGLQVSVENHRGLLGYSPERVTILAPQGRLHVVGQELQIGIIHAAEVTVTGRIVRIELEAEAT